VLLYGDKESLDNSSDGESTPFIWAVTVCPLMMAEMDYPLMVGVMDCTVIFGDKHDRQLTDGNQFGS